jgi:pimeloyl-ACP methyl ester carboxylesterase
MGLGQCGAVSHLYARSVADKVISNTKPSQVMTFGYSVGAVLSQAFASEISESGIDVRLAIGAAPSGIISQGVDQIVAALARSSGDFGERLRTSGIDALAHYYRRDTSRTVALRGIMKTISDMVSQPLSNLGLWRVDARDIYRRIIEQNLQRVGRVVTAFALQDQVTSPGAHAEIARFFSDNDNFTGLWTEGQHDSLASPANFTSLLLHTLENIKQTS